MKKTCMKCGKSRPINDFYKHPQTGDGHLNKCKECCRLDSIQNRRNKIDYYRDYDRNRNSLPHRQNLRKQFLLNQEAVEPEKRKARTAAGNALRDGRIQKEPCYFCGSHESLEMHHPDYSQPLRVYWLCRVCHRKLDNMEKIGVGITGGSIAK